MKCPKRDWRMMRTVRKAMQPHSSFLGSVFLGRAEGKNLTRLFPLGELVRPRGARLVARHRSTRPRSGHFLRHVQDQLAISLCRLGQQTAKLAEIACIFS